MRPALDEIRQNRIFTVSVSMDLSSYEQNLKIGEACDFVLPTFGVHPKRAPEYAGGLHDLSRWIDESPALGEIGLDFHWVEDATRYPAQLKVLHYFLAAAREQKKLVNLHTKGAERQILDLLEEYEIQRAIIHWYSGPLDLLNAFIDLGVFFTVGVEVLFSERIQAVARAIPLEKLLTETDNPGGLKWLRGSVGMPLALRDVITVLAGLKETSEKTIREIVQKNLLELTRGDPWLRNAHHQLAAGD
ncbi:MAG: TatD family hydrolase [Deltaproteobacteria bacterium]|nr:TatD family hydrolase [Deltaproteobacteria bacterium]